MYSPDYFFGREQAISNLRSAVDEQNFLNQGDEFFHGLIDFYEEIIEIEREIADCYDDVKKLRLEKRRRRQMRRYEKVIKYAKRKFDEEIARRENAT